MYSPQRFSQRARELSQAIYALGRENNMRTYIPDKCEYFPMTDIRQGGIVVTPRASQEFEEFVLGWLDRNQEGLEIGGTGNLKELETLCAAWARSNNLLGAARKKTEEGQLYNSVLEGASPGIEFLGRQEESDTDRLLRLQSEISRRAKLLSAMQTYPEP